MLKHLGAALGPGGSSYRVQRRGCGRGLPGAVALGKRGSLSRPGAQQEENQPLSPSSPSSVVGISHWLSSAVTQKQEAGSHGLLGQRNRLGTEDGWIWGVGGR